MPLKPGNRLGSYEITSLLGSGGMGEVYRAKDLKLGRDVAIKVIREELASDPDRLRRFEQEARSASALNHPNIITIHDIRLRRLSYGKHGAEIGQEEHLDYIVMEYVEGKTLREILCEGRVAAKKIVPLTAQIAEGLAKAHSAGIVHRDLKPENLMVTRDGYVKILDFGLAKLRPEAVGADSELVTLNREGTAPGVVMGTVGYMSPEQAAGRSVDYRTDQFAFGSILYEMLTGKKAFHGETGPEILAAVLRDEPEPFDTATGEVPPQLVSIVERCLSKDPDERYDSTRDLAKELRRLREMPSGSAVVSPRSQGVYPAVPRWRLAAGFAAVGVALGVITAAVFMRPGIKGHPSFPPDIQRYHMDLGGLGIPPPISGIAAMALSSDGKQMVFRGFSESGHNALYLRRFDQFEVTPIPDTEGASCPFFSPDGKWLGFEQRGELKKIFLEDGTTGTLCDAPRMRGASWGEDGTILFSARGEGLFRVSESGGAPVAVTRPDPTHQEWMHKFPQILPGARAALFTIQTLDFHGRTAGIVDLRTGENRVLLEDACYPRYVPTGHILFTRSGTLMAASFDLDRLELTEPAVPLLTGVFDDAGSGIACYEASAAGPLVFVPWEARPSKRRLVWLDRSGRVQPALGDPRPFDTLAISPDGRRLAFSVDSEDYSLFVMDLASGALSRVGEGATQPVWSPDGRFLFVLRFGAEDGKRTMRLDRLSPDTGDEPETIIEGEAQMMAVAPDGKFLIFCHQPAPGQWDISRVSLEGEKRIEPFLNTEESELAPAFSPEGLFVAYTSRETGRPQIFIRPSSGTGPKIPVPLAWSAGPIWRKAGLFVAGPSGKDDEIGVFQVDVATEPRLDIERVRFLFVVPKNLKPGKYDVAPDGQCFLMIENEPREMEPPPLAIIPNWLDEMRARLEEARP